VKILVLYLYNHARNDGLVIASV